MKEQFHTWYTQYLHRDFHMLVFGHSGFPVICFPPGGGRYYDLKDNGVINSCSHLINSGRIKLYCPDTIDSRSWFNYSIPAKERVDLYLQYEQVILNDVIEFAKYDSGFGNVGMFGLAFGSFNALNISFKYPEKIGYLYGVSGYYDIKPHIYGFYDENCYYNNPFDYIPNLNDAYQLDSLKWMDIGFGVGDYDIAKPDSEKLSALLYNKKIMHHIEYWEKGNHCWETWREFSPKFLARIKY
ncbi:MAG: esterase [Melioribacteraceae bacterium]|nr:esterase [Melioribacteraceae bacterium]